MGEEMREGGGTRRRQASGLCVCQLQPHLWNLEEEQQERQWQQRQQQQQQRLLRQKQLGEERVEGL